MVLALVLAMVCLTNVATTTTESQVVYQQGRGDFNDRSQNVSGTLTGLVPGARYRIGVEVLRNDLANYHERVKSITVGGTNMGECRPDGADFDCTFFRCPFDTTTVVTASASGTVPVAMVFQGHSWDCDCDTSSWECSKENTVAGRQPMTAVARFTWIRADWIFRFYSDAACTTPVTSAQPWVLSQGPSSECYKFSGSTYSMIAPGVSIECPDSTTSMLRAYSSPHCAPDTKLIDLPLARSVITAAECQPDPQGGSAQWWKLDAAVAPHDWPSCFPRPPAAGPAQPVDIPYRIVWYQNSSCDEPVLTHANSPKHWHMSSVGRPGSCYRLAKHAGVQVGSLAVSCSPLDSRLVVLKAYLDSACEGTHVFGYTFPKDFIQSGQCVTDPTHLYGDRHKAHGWRFQRYWPNAPPGKQLSNVPVHELPRCFNLSGAEMMNMTHADLRSIVDSEREVWFDAVVSLGSVFGFLLLVRLAWVAYLRYLRSKPHVMISYRHLDADFANRLHQQLQAAGFVVWIDTAITPGADWRQDIAAAIEKSIAVCFIISPGSVTSKYCKEELYYASALGKPIFPLVHTEAFDSMQGGVKTILQRIQWIRMDREFDPGFDQLVGELRSLDRKAAQAVISGGRAMKKSHSSGNWVTASSGGSESKQLQITSDVYVCHHPADTELAQQLHDIFVSYNLGSSIACREGSGCDVGESVNFAAQNPIELNTGRMESAHVFCFVMSAESMANETCGEELHAAYEIDKPLVVVTPGTVEDMPTILAQRGSMSMMIESDVDGLVAFGGGDTASKLHRVVGAVIVAKSKSLSNMSQAGKGTDADSEAAAVRRTSHCRPVRADQLDTALRSSYSSKRKSAKF